MIDFSALADLIRLKLEGYGLRLQLLYLACHRRVTSWRDRQYAAVVRHVFGGSKAVH